MKVNTITSEDITFIRNTLKMSLRQLGDIVGVSPSAIMQWERGESSPSRLHYAVLVKLKEIAIKQDSKEVKKILLSFLAVGSITALLSWMFSKDNES